MPQRCFAGVIEKMQPYTLYVHGDGDIAGTLVDPLRDINRFRSEDTSFPGLLAKKFNLELFNAARPAVSNEYVKRTTQENLHSMDPNRTIVIIGWCPFNRSEVFYDGEFHQINGGRWYNPPPELKCHHGEWLEKYMSSPERSDIWCQKQQELVMDLHVWLSCSGFAHRFLHCYRSFPENSKNFSRMDWPKRTWIDDCAYEGSRSLRGWLDSQGLITGDFVSDEAHAAYADHIDGSFRDLLTALDHSDLRGQR